MQRTPTDELALTLFDMPSPVGGAVESGAPEHKWSYSKSGALEQCPRKFYYRYYGGNQHKAKNDTEKQRLRRLKMVRNRHERTGDIIHFVIAHYFREAQAGRPMIREGVIEWARRVFIKDVSLSSQGFDETGLSLNGRDPKFLAEFLHETDPRDLCREAQEEMVAALETFLDAPEFAPLREMGMEPGSLIERHFTGLPKFTVVIEGQIDLAFRDATGGVTVVDWKSGDLSGEGDDSLQLAVYALWAKGYFGCDTEAITLYKAFLGSGELAQYPVSERMLKAAGLKIRQDAKRFAAMHEYGCTGNLSAFTPCAQEAVCRGCSFATICPEGKECLEW